MYQANSKVLSLSQLCQEVERKKAQGSGWCSQMAVLISCTGDMSVI